MNLSRLVPFAFFFTVGVAGCDSDKDKDKDKLSANDPVVTGTGAASGTTVTPMTVTPDQEKLLADLGGVKDAVCACPDRACVENAVKAGAAFDDRLNTMYEDEAKIPAAVKAAVDANQLSIEACTTRIGGFNAPLSAATIAVLAELDAVAARICKCADAACADAAMKKADALQTKLKGTFNAASDIPEEAMSRVAEVETRAKACLEKLPT